MVTYVDKPWLESYEERAPKELDFPDNTVHEWLEQSAKSHPEHTAIIFKGRKINYR